MMKMDARNGTFSVKEFKKGKKVALVAFNTLLFVASASCYKKKRGNSSRPSTQDLFSFFADIYRERAIPQTQNPLSVI